MDADLYVSIVVAIIAAATSLIAGRVSPKVQLDLGLRAGKVSPILLG